MIELPVGHIGEFGGRKFKVVEIPEQDELNSNAIKSYCAICAFRADDACGTHSCISFERKDQKEVYFPFIEETIEEPKP